MVLVGSLDVGGAIGGTAVVFSFIASGGVTCTTLLIASLDIEVAAVVAGAAVVLLIIASGGVGCSTVLVGSSDVEDATD